MAKPRAILRSGSAYAGALRSQQARERQHPSVLPRTIVVQHGRRAAGAGQLSSGCRIERRLRTAGER